jgi:hypothetical protein
VKSSNSRTVRRWRASRKSSDAGIAGLGWDGCLDLHTEPGCERGERIVRRLDEDYVGAWQ